MLPLEASEIERGRAVVRRCFTVGLQRSILKDIPRLPGQAEQVQGAGNYDNYDSDVNEDNDDN